MTPMIRFGKTPDGVPVEFSYEALKSKHIHVSGQTGSGKSQFVARTVASLCEQPDTAIAIIDFGFDKAQCHYLREVCNDTGKVFRLFSLDERDATESFEMFQSCAKLGGNIARIANFIAGALNLIYSEGYGRSFFSRLNTAVIASAVERLAHKGTEVSLHGLAKELAKMAREPRRHKEASEALFALDQLLHYPQLEGEEE